MLEATVYIINREPQRWFVWVSPGEYRVQLANGSVFVFSPSVHPGFAAVFS